MKFLIPSKGRADLVGTTVDLVGRRKALVYVAESELESYEKVLGKGIVRPVPREVFGMGAIRRYMVNKHRDEDYFFMIDDDVTGMEYKFSDKVTRVVDTQHIQEIIQNAYITANDLKTPLFGFVSSPNPMLYTQIDHVHFNGMIACGIGIIPKYLGTVNFDPRLVVYEDQDLCLQVKYHHRILFMDNRYNFRYGKTWVTEGGCSTLRNATILKQCSDILRKKWGSRVVQYSPKKPFQHVLRVGF